MIGRRKFITLRSGAGGCGARAQQPAVPVIGFSEDAPVKKMSVNGNDFVLALRWPLQ